MNKQTLKKALQVIACFLSWAVFPLLYCRCARRFNLIHKRWVRIVTLLLSPLFLVGYVFLYVIGSVSSYLVYDSFLLCHHYADHEVIEDITGATFPELEITEYRRGSRSFMSDYTDGLLLKFKEKPDDNLLHQLDSLKRADIHWTQRGNTYICDWTWGGNLPGPKGEDSISGHFFTLEYTKGSDTVNVTYGSW